GRAPAVFHSPNGRPDELGPSTDLVVVLGPWQPLADPLVDDGVHQQQRVETGVLAYAEQGAAQRQIRTRAVAGRGETGAPPLFGSQDADRPDGVPRVIESGGKRMLGRQAVVHADDGRAGTLGQQPAGVLDGLQTAAEEPAPVKVHDGASRAWGPIQ